MKFEGQSSTEAENFFESHAKKIAEISELFNTSDYKAFLTLPEKLTELEHLHKKYSGEIGTRLPESILEAVVTPEHLNEREKDYQSLEKEEGLYLPADTTGGGDYWARWNTGVNIGGIGQTKDKKLTKINLLDMAGHGREAIAAKAFLARLTELYHTAHPEGPKPDEPSIVAVLDEFIVNSPFPPVAEYAEVRTYTNESDRTTLQIERAGNPTVFVRHQKTGDTMIISEGYPILGAGMIANTPSATHEMTVDMPLDVFLASDGLLDIRLEDNTRFRNTFKQFCDDRKDLSPQQFRTELFDFVHNAKSEERVDDDVTILIQSIT